MEIIVCLGRADWWLKERTIEVVNAELGAIFGRLERRLRVEKLLSEK